MPTMQVLLSITFNLDFKTAKFLHLKIIKNNTFSGAASLGGLHVARKCGAVGAATSARRSVTRYMYVNSPSHGATLCHRFASP